MIGDLRQITLRVISMRDELEHGEVEINTTSRSSTPWQTGLSPFFLGPCDLYDGHVAKNVENAWQYAKLYNEHADLDLEPTQAYRDWAVKGWGTDRAHRYPMGKGRVPISSIWEGKHLNYIEARKAIYVPLYAEAVQKTQAWENLKDLYESGQEIALRDFNGYDHLAHRKTLTQVLNDPSMKMGHAFVLAMLLLKDPALTQCAMR